SFLWIAVLNCTCWNVSSDFTAMLDKCLRKNIESFGLGINLKRQSTKMSLSALSKQHAQKWSSLYALNVDASAFTLICDKLQALQHVQIEFYPQLSTCSA